MNLYDAVAIRMSVRSFEDVELNTELLDEIDIFVSTIIPYDSSIDVDIKLIKSQRKLMTPPYYAVLYSEEKAGCYMNAGYIMQQLVLYLTSRGIASCYKMIPVGIEAKDEQGRKCIISIAFGIAKEEMYRNPDRAKRNPLEKMCVIKTKLSREVRELLKAGRMAPSSFNSQPWRFVVSEKKIHIFKKESSTSVSNNIKDIDMGIMIANMVMCADELWIDIVVGDIEKVKAKKYANNVYVTSILVRE